MKRLEGKVAVITGGNSGIGLASAKRFLEEGARVAISGRNQKTLDEAVKSLGKDVLAVKADAARLDETEKFLKAVVQKFGRIDVLFVNAGVAKFAPLADTSESIFDEQFDINVKGAYYTIQKALPHLNDGASIILNTSVAGIKGNANTSAYSATKAALRSVARTAAVELASRNIRVNALAERGSGRVCEADHCHSAATTLGETRGSCRRGSFPGLIRCFVCDRSRTACRWGPRKRLKLCAATQEGAQGVVSRAPFSFAEEGSGEEATFASRYHLCDRSPVA
jgi:NAD(P)-dependent dehydrogenase (short-subunit alcohol dehydrogenase family)